MKRVAVCVVLVVGLLPACATSSGGSRSTRAATAPHAATDDRAAGPVAREPSPAVSAADDELAERLWVESGQARDLGDEVEARRTLARLVRAAPGTSHEAGARLALAQQALTRRDWEAASGWVAPLQASFGRSRVVALAHEGREDYQSAADAWLEASKAADKDEERVEATEGAARGLFLTGRASEARAQLAATGQEAGRIRVLVEGRLTPLVAAKVFAALPEGDPDAGWVAMRHAQVRCGMADMVGCREGLQRAIASGDPALQEAAQPLADRLTSWDRVVPTRVGVLLPLSGPYQQIGQAALEGIQMVFSQRSNKTIKLVVRDTKGDAVEAARQAESLILERNVVALLGPVGEHETRAAVASAARFGVPHLVLASARDTSEGVESAIRVRLSALEQAEAVARYAVTDLGVRRFAVLFPHNRAGQRLMGAFWDEVVRLGGEVRAAQGYGAKERNFNGPIRGLIGAAKPGKGTHDFEALFIPDDALSVRRLVPFLKYWGVRVKTRPGVKGSTRRPLVQLLGAAGWNHGSVIDKGDNLTDNAVFVDAFVHDPNDAASDDFARAFFARYRRKPTTFHAEVHDGAAILARSLAGLKGTSHAVRAEALGSLRGLKHHRGVTGHFTILPSGVVMRRPRLLTIDLDDIRPRLSEDEERYLRNRRLHSGPR